jgi:DNA-directed RNA polymerase subunit K
MVWPMNRFTRFEVARLLGARSLQISLGAPVLVNVEGNKSSMEIAKEEFRNKVIPITIKRKLPNGKEVVVDVKSAIDNWLKDHAGVI